jgi:hypothetical protein
MPSKAIFDIVGYSRASVESLGALLQVLQQEQVAMTPNKPGYQILHAKNWET